MGKPIKGKSLEEHTLPGEVWRRLDDKWEGWSHHYFSNFGRLYGTQRRRLLTLTSEGCFQPRHPEKGQKKVSPSTLMRTFFPYEWIKDLDDDEEVRPIKEHPSYFITTKGRVFSWKTYSWLVPNNHSYYYWCVVLDGKTTNIHKLVGRHFLPWEEGLCVLHKNEELPFPEINFLSNLWVGTMKENNDDKMEKGRLVSPFVKGHKLWDKWFSEGKTNNWRVCYNKSNREH